MDDITFCRNMLNLIWFFSFLLAMSLRKQQQKKLREFANRALELENKQRDKREKIEKLIPFSFFVLGLRL